MRRVSMVMAVSLMLMTTGSAWADGESAPPPPPSSASGSSWRQPGHLLDASDQKRSQELSFFVGLPYGYWFYGFGLGLGARYYIPIVANGFIPALNDEFGIEFGADFYGHFGYYGYGFWPQLDIPVEALWRFHFTPKLDAYAKIGLGLTIDFAYPGNGGGAYFFPYFTTGVGIFYKLTDTISLRGEVGYPGIRAGISIAL